MGWNQINIHHIFSISHSISNQEQEKQIYIISNKPKYSIKCYLKVSFKNLITYIKTWFKQNRDFMEICLDPKYTIIIACS